MRCPVTNKVHTEVHGICSPRQSYSKFGGELITRYTKYIDNKTASRLLGIPTSILYRIDYNELKKKFSFYKTERLSIGEISFKRGHRYATILFDYDRNKVLRVERGRKIDNAKTALEQINDCNLKVVTVDFWLSYEKAVKELFPRADIVYDYFHLSRILNCKIEEERRDICLYHCPNVSDTGNLRV
ncbi:transposase [Deferribacter autotrophicus]|uniref:transposase n=1 Tax=Deferribacter autotrophicus TaxID=500465 RepID=UPI00165EA202|nr:transposase [Deferribacter autotrophicus]